MFFAKHNALAFYIALVFYSIAIVYQLALIPYGLIHKRNNSLRNFNLAFILCGFAFIGFSSFIPLFVCQVFIFDSAIWSVASALAALTYCLLVFQLGRKQIKDNAKVYERAVKNGFVERDGQVVLLFNTISGMGAALNPTPIRAPFLCAAAIALVGLIVLLFNLGVPYSPNLFMQAFLAVFGLLVTPTLIIYGLGCHQVHCALPKRVFGAQWKNVQREVL